MASIWQNNPKLKKWEKKNFRGNVNGDFNYNLASPLEDPLLNAIADYLGINKKLIYVGAGSSQLISVITSLPQWDKVFLPEIEFSLYKKTAHVYNKKIIYIKNKTLEDFITNLKKEKSNETDLLCFSSPRWFDGGMFNKKQIIEILNIFKGTIVVDEAYIDYSYDSRGLLDLCLKNERIILLRSFSKKFLASGFRVGYMITKKEINGFRDTIIPPHSISSYSENFFVKLLSDTNLLKSFKETQEYIRANRDLMIKELNKLGNIEILPSEANFITLIFKNNIDMNKVYNCLSDLSGIQKFNDGIPFIKIWINNEKFSLLVINRIQEVLK